MHVLLLLEIPIHLSKTTDWTSSTKVSVLRGRFWLCIKLLDILLPKYVSWLRLLAWNCQKCDSWLLFPIVKLISSRSTSGISTIKISQDSSKFSKGDSEKYLRFSTLLRRPGKSIMPWVVEVSGGIDVCVKPLKTRLKTVFSFFNCLQNLIKIFVIGQKYAGVRPLSSLHFIPKTHHSWINLIGPNFFSWSPNVDLSKIFLTLIDSPVKYAVLRGTPPILPFQKAKTQFFVTEILFPTEVMTASTLHCQTFSEARVFCKPKAPPPPRCFSGMSDKKFRHKIWYVICSYQNYRKRKLQKCSIEYFPNALLHAPRVLWW